MLLFCDTSALIKLIIEEDGSAAMEDLVVKAGSPVAVASLAYAEAYAALARRGRELTLQKDELREATEALDELWPGLLETSFGPAYSPWISKLCRSYPLRGADAVHLATALSLQAEGLDIRFVTSDRRQFEAALGEDLRPVDPTTSDAG